MGLKLKYKLLLGFAIIVCIHSSVIKPSHVLDHHGYNVAVAKRSTHTSDHATDPVGTNGTGDTNHTEGHAEHVHHAMHVASWQFERVKSPFIIAVFLITAGIAKLGKTLIYFSSKS